MAQQVVNIGTAPDDGTGDNPRAAFDKCNQNFTELYAAQYEYVSYYGTEEEPIEGKIAQFVAGGVDEEYVIRGVDAATLGIEGPPGPQGPTGATGPQGPKGDPGAGGGLLAIRVITASGSYTPTAGMVNCLIETIGGGGAGGGTGDATGVAFGASGGGAGGYSRAFKTAAQVGASQSVTIGAGGTGVSAAAGNNGGDTFVGATLAGSLCGAKGGSGGAALTSGLGLGAPGGGGAAASGVGDLKASGAPGSIGCYGSTTVFTGAGNGGSSQLGGGAVGNSLQSGSAAGVAATAYGSGGAGSHNYNTSTSRAGGAGSAGVVIITEYK